MEKENESEVRKSIAGHTLKTMNIHYSMIHNYRKVMSPQFSIALNPKSGRATMSCLGSGNGMLKYVSK